MKFLAIVGLVLGASAGCDGSPDQGGFGAQMPGDIRGRIDAGSAGGSNATSNGGTNGAAGHIGGTGGHLGAGGSGVGGALTGAGGAVGGGGAAGVGGSYFSAGGSGAGGSGAGGSGVSLSDCAGMDCSNGGGSAACRQALGQGLYCRDGSFATTCAGCTCDQAKTCYTMPYQDSVTCSSDTQCASGNCWNQSACEPQGFGGGDATAAPHCTSLGWIPNAGDIILCGGPFSGLTRTYKTKFGFVCGTYLDPTCSSGSTALECAPAGAWADCRSGDIRTAAAQTLLVADCSECQ